jgi:hypothetical protein
MTPNQTDILAALRSSGEAGDLLCLHAAAEIERLRLAAVERDAMLLNAEEEIVSTIEAFGEELAGKPDAIANVIKALAESLRPSPEVMRYREVRDETDYESCEASDYGRMIARAAHSSDQIWDSLLNELSRIEHWVRNTMEFYI